MLNTDIVIIQSLLNQIGGPISYKDLEIVQYSNFQLKWPDYKKKIILNIRNLSREENIFLISMIMFIHDKLAWETSTVTGYSDEDINSVILKLKNEFKLDISSIGNLNDSLPIDLK